MPIQIFIDYRLIHDKKWVTVEFSPEEYFDLELLDPDEELEWDWIAEYDKDIEYLDIEPSQVLNTRLRIISPEKEASRVITTTFWNQGKNSIAERFDQVSGKSDWLGVVCNIIQENPRVWEIIRLLREEDGTIEIEFHSFITDNEDGSQSEKIVYSRT